MPRPISTTRRRIVASKYSAAHLSHTPTSRSSCSGNYRRQRLTRQPWRQHVVGAVRGTVDAPVYRNCGIFSVSPFFSADWWETIPATVMFSAMRDVDQRLAVFEDRRDELVHQVAVRAAVAARARRPAAAAGIPGRAVSSPRRCSSCRSSSPAARAPGPFRLRARACPSLRPSAPCRLRWCRSSAISVPKGFL